MIKSKKVLSVVQKIRRLALNVRMVFDYLAHDPKMAASTETALEQIYRAKGVAKPTRV